MTIKCQIRVKFTALSISGSLSARSWRILRKVRLCAFIFLIPLPYPSQHLPEHCSLNFIITSYNLSQQKVWLKYRNIMVLQNKAYINLRLTSNKCREPPGRMMACCLMCSTPARPICTITLWFLCPKPVSVQNLFRHDSALPCFANAWLYSQSWLMLSQMGQDCSQHVADGTSESTYAHGKTLSSPPGAAGWMSH